MGSQSVNNCLQQIQVVDSQPSPDTDFWKTSSWSEIMREVGEKWGRKGDPLVDVEGREVKGMTLQKKDHIFKMNAFIFRYRGI